VSHWNSSPPVQKGLIAIRSLTRRRCDNWPALLASSLSDAAPTGSGLRRRPSRPWLLTPPTILISFDGAASIAQAAIQAPFGVSVLAASHAEIADRFRDGALVEATADDFEGSWETSPNGIVLRSDAVAALECEAEEIIDRHGRAIVIGRVRDVFKIGGSGALVYWGGAYNSIGWTDDEVRRAVGLFPAAR
jgi:Flavin reductase like domain